MVNKSARRIAGRIACVLLVAAGLILASSSTAQASKPMFTRSGPYDDHYIDTSCGFDIAVHASGLGGHEILKVDSAGNFRDIVQANLAVEVLTNPQTDKTIRVNVSGGGKYTGNVNSTGAFFPFTLTGFGVWAWPRNPNDPSQLGMFVSYGRFVEMRDAQGAIMVPKAPGRVRDMCAELAN